jgi:enamine deaminase RidA (YjgF/YER057c/UK114 family)
MSARLFVPFGTHWTMGIEVPYSFGVIDGGQFWSCGQCPLDLDANVRAPGDLEAQLRIVAGYIRDQFSPYGVPPGRIDKLVAYIVGDEADLEMTQRVLRAELAPTALVLAVGAPHFYYPGMRVEIDVYGTGDGSAAELAHRVGDRLGAAGLQSTDGLVSCRLYVARDAGLSDAVRRQAEPLAHDLGAAICATLPAASPALADLVTVAGAGVKVESIDTPAGVRLTKRRAGRYLGLLGRSICPGRSLPDSTQDIMEALSGALRDERLGFADVVKQQTHYVGTSAADDLYANMRIRNSCYTKPGPASTGLAVYGFADPETKITIELLAIRR